MINLMLILALVRDKIENKKISKSSFFNRHRQ